MNREQVNDLLANLIQEETISFVEKFGDDDKTKLTPDVLYGIIMECSAHVTVAILESFGLISVKD